MGVIRHRNDRSSALNKFVLICDDNDDDDDDMTMWKNECREKCDERKVLSELQKYFFRHFSTVEPFSLFILHPTIAIVISILLCKYDQQIPDAEKS